MSATENSIQRLYVAYFNRPADPISLQVYADMIDSGAKTLEQIAAEYFANSQEYLDLYAGKSNAQIVDQLYQNIFGRSAEADGLVHWAAKLTSGAMTVADIALTLSYSAQGTDADVVAARIEAAVAFTTALNTPAEITGYSGNAAAAEGRTYLAQISGALPTDTATITAAKDAAVTNVDASVAAAVAAGTPGMAKQTFTLTTSADDFTGQGGDDTFNGAFADAEKTLTVSDKLDGGDGTDTLNITIGTMAADPGTTSEILQNATITNMENFSVKAVSGRTINQDFAAVTGEENIASNLSTDAIVLTNVGAGTSFDIVGNGAVTNGDFTATYVAAATAADLDVMSGTTAGNVSISGTGVKSVSITSTGAANTIGTLGLPATATAVTIDATTKLTTGAITAAGLKTLTITGAGGVDINAGALATTVTTIDASAATGDVDVTTGNIGTDAGGAVDGIDLTVTTGSGADEVDVSAVLAGGEVSVSTGAGNDLVTIGAAITNSSATTSGDVLDGGADTDTLKMTTALAQGFTTASNTISNFEALTISNAMTAGTTTMKNIQAGLTTVNLDAGGTGTIVTEAGSSPTINIKASLTAGGLTLNDTGTGTTESVTLKNTGTTVDMANGNALTVGGIETVNIVSTGAGTATSQDFGAITITPDTGGTATLNISGGNSVTANAITAAVVDASGLAAGKTFTMNVAMENNLASGSATLTGSSGNDTLTGDTNESTNINGGGGNDIITGGSAAEIINGDAGNDIIGGGGGADTINGGAGNDTITMAGTAETIDGGAGNDIVVAAGNLAYGISVKGGADTDTLSIDTQEAAPAGAVVSEFEVLTIAGNITQDLDAFSNNTFDKVTVGANTVTIQSVRDENIVITAALAGDLTVTKESATGTADTQTITLSSAAALDTTNDILVAGVETINLVMDDTNTTAHVNTVDLGAAAATTVNVSGDAGVVFATGGNTDVSKVTTMDASGVVLPAVTDTGVTYAATYNVVGGVTTITGSNGIDNLTGGANTNDTISGGSGADTIVYTGGTDSFTGGAGVDTFDVNNKGAAVASASLTITDVAYNDVLDLAGVLDNNMTGAMTSANWDAAEVTLGASATLGNYLDSAASGTGGGTNAVIKWFYFGGDTYIVVDNSNNATYTAGTDVVIKLSGTLDIDKSTATAAGVITFGGP